MQAGGVVFCLKGGGQPYPKNLDKKKKSNSHTIVSLKPSFVLGEAGVYNTKNFNFTVNILIFTSFFFTCTQNNRGANSIFYK